MQLGRRIVTLIANLALLQLMLLGTGVPCTTPMADAGPHAEHSADGRDAGAAHSAAHQAHDAEREIPSTDCGLRACTVSPVLLNDGLAIASAIPQPDGIEAAIDRSPSSPARSLDPPPPRA